MDRENSDKLVLIGAGNLAWHLGPVLQDSYTILQVFSRTEASARALGQRLGVDWTSDPGHLNADAGILLFCVSDRAISDLLCRIELKKVMMIHTSGSVPADVFKGIAKDYGVLYPLMTFSKDRAVNFRNIPVCIEGSTADSIAILEKMAGSISERIERMNSEQRKILHLSGIFACNFSNHMYQLGQDFLSTGGMDFDLLKPLITETAAKVMEMDPASAQTGPASRNDAAIVRGHIDMLKGHPELQKIYTFVSDSITNHFRNK